METIIAACCMILIGSVAAHPEESPLKRFRVAQDRIQCLTQCDSILIQCRQPCGVPAECRERDDINETVIALRLVLQPERVPCLPQ
jgi:hypothetical protein